MNYYSYEEIHKSYKEIEKTKNEVLKNKKAIEKLLTTTKDIVLFGCGSSYWCSLSIARTINCRTEKFAQAFKATEVAMHLIDYKNRFNNPLFLIPTRSGASQELLITMNKMLEYYPNSKVIVLSEYLDNEMEKIADLTISIPWANEISVCQTRSFNCLYSGLLTLVSFIEKGNVLLTNLNEYLNKAEALYADTEAKVKLLLNNRNDLEVITLGSGVAYGAVIEGAYIVVEMAQERANFYQTLEYRHGPIVCTNKNTFIFLCNTSIQNETVELSMAEEAKKKGAKIALCSYTDSHKIGDFNFPLTNNCEEIKGLYFVTVMQMVAYQFALNKNLNPDQPGDLVKFIQY